MSWAEKVTTDHGLRTTDQKPPLVTTYLEMRSPEQLRPKRVTSDKWRVTSFEKTDASWRFNRDMYFRVGEQWQWTDKLQWTDEQWKEYAAAPVLRTFAAYYNDALSGYYELRRSEQDDVEIAYFGLLPEFIGRSLGGALLTSAIEEAWSRRGGIAPTRVWVHTCNRDHPQALANYQARGMIVYKIEESRRGKIYE
ncbi:MAG: GNAT family N-acetyltransferase [Candidatus Udaeobacter sp.]